MYAPPPAARQRRPKAKHSNRTLWLIGGGTAALVVLTVVAAFAGLFLLALMPDRIASGVEVAGVALGGKTAQEASAAIHETDKAIFQQANRYAANLAAMGIYDDTDIAASNDTATWRAQFTEDDASLPAAYTGGRR